MAITDVSEQTRTRLIGTLFAGNAITSTGYIGVITVSTLISEQITGSTGLSGIPGTFGTVGVAVGAASLSALSLRIGRRPSFAAGYALATLGSVLAGLSIVFDSFTLLLIGMLAIGFGRSVGQLARYAAGDLRHSDHRARAISLIVWASTIGAIVGPLLIGPTSSAASAGGLDELLGPIAIGIVGFGLGSLLMFVGLHPDPLTVAFVERNEEADAKPAPIAKLLRIPTVQLSLAALMTSQFVMALIMVMTPLYIRSHDGDLATVGWVMMAHTVGMFAIAPVTGWLVDRYGPSTIIITAVALLSASGLIAAMADDAQTPILIIGLFVLGVGWNFGFVAGSTLLQEGLTIVDRLKIQGFADSTTWISGAVGAGASGVIVAVSSYVVLSLLGAGLALVPLILWFKTRTS
ncbi:MAG: MFS transporter [Actinomycetia bacterium]|nr:MFS transporter [Actinomycetes bacterium]